MDLASKGSKHHVILGAFGLLGFTLLASYLFLSRGKDLNIAYQKPNTNPTSNKTNHRQKSGPSTSTKPQDTPKHLPSLQKTCGILLPLSLR